MTPVTTQGLGSQRGCPTKKTAFAPELPTRASVTDTFLKIIWDNTATDHWAGSESLGQRFVFGLRQVLFLWGATQARPCWCFLSL